MDELIEDYDNQRVLIELLSKSIERWEEAAGEFTEFSLPATDGDPVVPCVHRLSNTAENAS